YPARGVVAEAVPRRARKGAAARCCGVAALGRGWKERLWTSLRLFSGQTPMDANTIASVVSAGIAVVSVLVGVYFTRKAIILQHELKDLQQRATQLQYFAELRTWAGEAVQILAEAVHLSIMDRRVYKPGEF